MSEEVSLAELLDHWRSADQQAVLAVYQRFESRILRFAQPKINPKIYPRFDAEDIMVTVLRIVVGRIHQGQYSVDSKGSIWNLVRKVTLN